MAHVCRCVCDAERDAPVGRRDVRFVHAVSGRDILAARECGRGTRAGIPKEFVLIHRRRELSAIDGRDLACNAECLIAIVRDQNCRDVLHGENLAQGDFDLPLEMCVESGERLIEEQHIRAACEDACKGDALLLSAREPRRIGMLQPFQRESCDVLLEDTLLFLL